jgi:hypothetical protein
MLPAGTVSCCTSEITCCTNLVPNQQQHQCGILQGESRSFICVSKLQNKCLPYVCKVTHGTGTWASFYLSFYQGSVTFWYRSGSLDPYTWLLIRIQNLLFLSVTLKMPTKNKCFFLICFACYFCRYIYICLQKSLRSHLAAEIKVFLDFLLVVGRMRNRTNNYGSGRPKTYGSGTLFFTSLFDFNQGWH